MARGRNTPRWWLCAMLLTMTLSLSGYLHLARKVQQLEARIDREVKGVLPLPHREVPKQVLPVATPLPAPQPEPPAKKPKQQPQLDQSLGAQFGILEDFSVMTVQAYEGKKALHQLSIHTSGVYYSYMDNPKRYYALRGVAATYGYLETKVPQSYHPTFSTKKDQRYFEGYKYKKPHMCPGKPYECSGRGVCDYERGVCTCMPPWTGWLCDIKMKPSAGSVEVNDFTQDQCADQTISAPSAEKWDQRTEERCKNMNDTNGMWLGLTKKATRIIALSIAETLGVERGSKVLDIGMGCGTLTEYIKGWVDIDMYGIDYSQAAVKYVRNRNKGGTFCVADVRDLGFIPSASMDYAFENGVFSVTRDGHCETYKNVMRILKPGGTLLIMQTYTDWHSVKCWQNIRMLSVENCLKDLGFRFEYILTRETTGSKYDSYCAGETYTALIRKPL